MTPRDAYLPEILAFDVAGGLEPLFHLRRLRRAEQARSETKSDAGQPAFIPLEQVTETLRRVEAHLFKAPLRDNAAALASIAGRTDVHTRWWRRLLAANESRPALDALANQSRHWDLILERLKEIVAAPQASRDEERNRFWSEVEPIFAPPGSRRNANIYELNQLYGGRTAFETLMSRLSMDAPGFHSLEPVFFANFNPDARAGTSGLLSDQTTPRSRYCPVDDTGIKRDSTRARGLALASFAAAGVFWAWLVFFRT